MAVADIVAAVIVVPTIGAALDWAYFCESPLNQIKSSAMPVLAIMAVGAVAWVLIGLPVHYLRVESNKTSIWQYVFPAVVAGGVVGMIYIPLFPITAPTGMLLGAINAAIFWFIRRPDRDIQVCRLPEAAP